MCCVMPPASPPATSALRILSSRLVLPWSTWPMIVTTGGRVVRDVGVDGSLFLAARLGDRLLLALADVLDLPAELAGEDLRRVGVERRVDVDVAHPHRQELHQKLGRLEAHLLGHRLERDVALDADDLLVRAHLLRGDHRGLARPDRAHRPPARAARSAAHHRATGLLAGRAHVATRARPAHRPRARVVLHAARHVRLRSPTRVRAALWRRHRHAGAAASSTRRRSSEAAARAGSRRAARARAAEAAAARRRRRGDRRRRGRRRRRRRADGGGGAATTGGGGAAAPRPRRRRARRRRRCRRSTRSGRGARRAAGSAGSRPASGARPAGSSRRAARATARALALLGDGQAAALGGLAARRDRSRAAGAARAT